MHEKDRRRLQVGPHLTLLFENGQTVWYQIEEMIRAEKLTSRETILREIETYNELMPAPSEIAATLLIEYADAGERDRALRALIGLERHIWLVLGARRMPARFDDRQMASDQISAVQFVRFGLEQVTSAAFIDLAQSGQAAIDVDHPALSAHTPIPEPMARALAADLDEP